MPNYKTKLIELLSKYEIVFLEDFGDHVGVLFKDCNDFTDFEEVARLGFIVKFADDHWINFCDVRWCLNDI